jgi:hypothetical protein
MNLQRIPMGRETISLDGEWRFAFCGDEVVALEDVELWRPTVVPAPWQAQHDDLRERNGRAWYRRRIEVPRRWRHAPVYLQFGAVNYLATVFVNGIEAGRHEGGYLPFEFEIGDLLHAGGNDIAVHVTAPNDDPVAYPETPFAEVPFGKQSWYGPLGGIWQSVTLERRAADHIAGVRVVATLGDGIVRATISLARTLNADYEIELYISGPSGDRAASIVRIVAAGERQAEIELTVPAPGAWSPDAPNLYRLTATLRRQDECVDAVGETFGFRSVEIRDGRIILNGDPIYLRGALDQDYYPDGICSVPSLAFLEDQFRKAKELGLNCLRCHIKVPDPRYYEVADRIGLLIWSELPNTGRLSDAAKERLEATMRGILARDGNHPSIFCWTIINENWGTDLVHDSEHRAWLNGMYHWLKVEDPTRLVVDNSPLAPSFHVETDIQDFHFYAAIPDHRASWDEFVGRLASRPSWTHTPHGDVRRTGHEPLICSEFGNWGLPDPALLRGHDGSEPWWFETGSDWSDGVMYPHGIENRFLTAGLDRVFGSLGAFVEAAQWQQYRALMYQIETMRRRPEIAGYVITEFTDCHWESNGLLDMRRNRRVFHQAFSAFNTDTVVVPRWDRLAYWSGETIEFDAVVANGAASALRDTELRLTLDSGSGGAQRLDIAPSSVSAPVPMRFFAPEVAHPEVHRLEFELDRRGEVLATNHLDIAIFPRRAGPAHGEISVWCAEHGLRERFAALGYRIAADAAGAGVVVATEPGPALAESIRTGARVVLLLDAPAELQPIFPHWQGVRVAARHGSAWVGAWASSFEWLQRRGALARLPGGPLIDHAFDRVIPEHVITGCNRWDFQSRVHAGIVVGWVHNPAAFILEREYGRGKVVATTFRLLHDEPGKDPTATTLLDALVQLAGAGAERAVAAPREDVLAPTVPA